jgi:anti-anti-sigma factor
MKNIEPSPVLSNSSPELYIRISFRTSGTPTALLTLTGTISKPNIKLLRSAFDECLANKKNSIIVDMKKVDVVSSDGWRHLVAEEKRLRSKNVALLLFGIQPDVYAVLNDLDHHDKIKTYSTITECQKNIELIGKYQTLLEPRSQETDTKNKNSKLNSRPTKSIPEEEIKFSGRSVPEKIHAIISTYGPCSVLQILSHLHSTEFEKEKIGIFKLTSILKEMNCETRKKRERFYRSC